MGQADDAPRGSATAALLAAGVPRHHRRGARLHDPGDWSDRASFVRTGIAKVVAPRLDGTEVVLALRGPGSWLDGQSALSDTPRSTGAVALTDLAVVEVDRDRLLGEIRRRPELSEQLLVQLGGALRSAFNDLRAQAEGDSIALIARRLMQLIDEPMFAAWRSTTTGSVVVRMPMSQHDLASWAGISTRAATLALRRLRDEGIVSTSRMRLEVHDPAALEARAAAGESNRSA